MNYKIQTKTIVNEDNIKYSAVNPKEVQLWIVSTDGEVLIKNSGQSINGICSLTLSGSSKEEVYQSIDKEIGILCTSEYMKPCFSFEVGTKSIDAYIITINLSTEHKELVESKYNGTFVDYRELMSTLASRKISSECKESLLNLISTLYDKYNFM